MGFLKIEKDNLLSEPKYYSEKDLEGLLEYCENQVNSHKGFFHKDIYAQMIDYAGNPEGFPSAEKVYNGEDLYISLKEPMKKLIDICKERYGL